MTDHFPDLAQLGCVYLKPHFEMISVLAGPIHSLATLGQQRPVSAQRRFPSAPEAP
jgi:hypothetical protein